VDLSELYENPLFYSTSAFQQNSNVISLQKVVITLNLKDIQSKNKTLRRKIRNNVNRPCSDETLLTAFFVRYQTKISPINKYPYLYKYEYEVVSGRSDFGKGDLIFTDGKNGFCIAEVKHLNNDSGRNARARRNTKRRYVRYQARYYKSWFQGKHPEENIESCYLTNDLFKRNYTLRCLFLKFKEQKELLWKKRLEKNQITK